MKYSVAKKISSQECYNNEFQVISLHSDFDSALESAGQNEAVIEVSDSVAVGESINDNGQVWVSEA